MTNTLDELTLVFRQVFDDDSLVLTPHATADDIDGWDSFSHINLIMAVENHFHVRFQQKEVISLKNVGELAALVESKRSN